MRFLEARLGNIHLIIYTFVLDIYCQQLGDICQLEGVCAPFGHKVGEYTFCNIYICTFVLDIYCQQLRGICQLHSVYAPFGHKVGEYTFCNIYICIGYILPTIGGYMSVAECLCALWAQGWGIYIHLYWIYTSNNWEIYVSFKVSVRPLGPGFGNIHYIIPTFVLDILPTIGGYVSCERGIYIL